MDSKEIAIASDHGAFELKELLVAYLLKLGYKPVDLGVHDETSVDYPDYGEKVAEMVSTGKVSRGILLCGTGIGMSITANKFPRVRATLVHDNYTAKMSRLHNDSNVLVLGARTTGLNVAYDILETWIETPYEGGRHANRLNKITELEKNWSSKK